MIAYNSDDTLAQSVEAAVSAGADEVIVLDNGASSRTNPLPPLPSTVRVAAAPENLGFGRGVNAAAELVRPDSDLLLVNPDCIIDRSVVDALRGALAEDETIGAAAPLMRYPDGSYGFAGGAEPSLLKELISSAGIDDLLPDRLRGVLLRLWDRLMPGSSYSESTRAGAPIEMDWVSGFCLLIRREAFEAVGGFDPDFFLYFEDVDLCRSIRDAGWTTTLIRSTSALHFESRSSTRQEKSLHYRTGFVTYLRKHRGTRASSLASVLLGVTS